MKKMMLNIGIIFLLLLGVSFSGCVQEGSDWGDEGELLVEIAVYPEVTTLFNGTMVNFTLINNGTIKLRVLFPFYMAPPFVLIIMDSNGTYVRSLVAYEPPPDPHNDDLKVLKPGQNTTKQVRIKQDIFDIKSNETYSVQGHYKIQKERSVTLPYWTGDILSNVVNFTIL